MAQYWPPELLFQACMAHSVQFWHFVSVVQETSLNSQRHTWHTSTSMLKCNCFYTYVFVSRVEVSSLLFQAVVQAGHGITRISSLKTWQYKVALKLSLVCTPQFLKHLPVVSDNSRIQRYIAPKGSRTITLTNRFHSFSSCGGLRNELFAIWQCAPTTTTVCNANRRRGLAVLSLFFTYLRLRRKVVSVSAFSLRQFQSAQRLRLLERLPRHLAGHHLLTLICFLLVPVWN